MQKESSADVIAKFSAAIEPGETLGKEINRRIKEIVMSEENRQDTYVESAITAAAIVEFADFTKQVFQSFGYDEELAARKVVSMILAGAVEFLKLNNCYNSPERFGLHAYSCAKLADDNPKLGEFIAAVMPMANDAITWADLLEIYQNSVWVDDHIANLTIVSEGIARTLKLVETSDRAYHEADIALQDDKTQLTVDSVVEVRIGSPHRSLGLLVKDWDALLASSVSRMREPSAFFIRSDQTHNATLPPTDTLLRYRSTIKLVKLLSESALFADQQQAKLVYFVDARTEVPVKFTVKDLRSIDSAQVDLLEKALEGEVHAEQRLGILAAAVAELVSGQSAAGRFHYLMQNVDELVRRVNDGYRLFASSFSYSKIRSELEKTQSEYVARIHKTFSDQNKLDQDLTDE